MMFTAKEEHKVVPLDVYEEGAVIEGLNKLRTEQLEKDGASDFVSELMLKIIQAPAKKSVGRGGETEQASFYRNNGNVSERSPRQRDEAR